MEDSSAVPSPSLEFSQQWTAHQSTLFVHLRTLIGASAEVLDLWRGIVREVGTDSSSYDPRQPFASWVLALARLNATTWRQQQSPDCLVLNDQLFSQVAARLEQMTVDPAARLNTLELRLKTLPIPFRDLLLARYRKKEPVQDIATRLEQSVETVSLSLYRIRQMLAEGIRMAGVVGSGASSATPTPFDKLLAGLIDQKPDPAHNRLLADQIRQYPGLLDRYLEQFEIHALLEWLEDPAFGASVSGGAVAHRPQVVVASVGGARPVVSAPRGKISKRWCWWLIAAGVGMVIALAVVLSLLPREKARPAEPPALSILQDRVSILREGKESEAKAGDLLKPGDELRVSSDGLVVFRYPDLTRIELVGKSSLVLEPAGLLRSSDKRFWLKQGRLTVTAPNRPGRHTAIVRTTSCEVSINSGDLVLTVGKTDGVQLDLQEGSGSLVRLSDHQKVEVKAGQSLRCTASGDLKEQLTALTRADNDAKSSKDSHVYECESLMKNVSQGATLTVLDGDKNFSRGQAVKLSGASVKNGIDFAVRVMVPGTYNVKVRGKNIPDRGQYQLTINNVNQGPVIDQSQESDEPTYPEVDLGNVTIPKAGHCHFRFGLAGTGRTGSSDLVFDYIRLTMVKPEVAGGGGTNLALKRPATASSVKATENLPPEWAVDGDPKTRWCSLNSDPQWLCVDLGASCSISRVRLVWAASYGKSYKIQVSDDATHWKDLCQKKDGEGKTDEFNDLTGKGRYVRMYGISRGTPGAYSLWEFEVYGERLP